MQDKELARSLQLPGTCSGTNEKLDMASRKNRQHSKYMRLSSLEKWD